MTFGTEVDHATRPSIEEIERVVALAVRAPSIHNTQPWRFVLSPDALELWADRRRQLASQHCVQHAPCPVVVVPQ